MKILILGAGRVGQSVAQSLVSDANDITIVDESADRIEQMQERFDLRGIVGDASSPSVLSSAGAMDSDLLIAVTANDETNLVACTLAAQIFNVPMRIARVRDSELRHYPRILGDEGFRATSVIWPEQAMATQFAKLITFPAAQQVLNFAENKLTLFTVNSTDSAPLTGKTLEDAFRMMPEAKMRFISIYRRNRRLECRNDTVIEADDEITVLVSSECAEMVIEALHPFEKAETIVLINGGELSGLLTDELEPARSKRRIKIFVAAIVCARELGADYADIARVLSETPPPEGRFELIERDGVKFIVDFAHTPDGLENVLLQARKLTEGRLIAVFGCGGDRDRGKRPLMGAIASEYADEVLITSDNPRGEKREDIARDIIAGTDGSARVLLDRREALQEACNAARAGDTVVIAGKGSEKYIEEKGVKTYFDDVEVLKEILAKK